MFAAAAAGYTYTGTKPCEDVDVTLVVDKEFGDSHLTFARGDVQRRQTIFHHEIHIGA